MDLLSLEVLEVKDYHLEVVGVHNQVVKNYPTVRKGYIFDFFVGDHSINTWEHKNFEYTLDYSWKFLWPGPLDKLEQRLEVFKDNFIKNKDLFIEDIDQFASLMIFIVKQPDSQSHEIVISSEDFGFDKLIPVFTQ